MFNYVVCAVLLALSVPLSALAERRPNVLFIAVDDLRPQLGAYGNDFMVTPHMDRLAAEGRLFSRHYVAVPTCGASRYALLTGQLPKQELSMGNNAFKLYESGHAPVSLPEWFRTHGYRTVQIGKVSHSADGYRYRQDGPAYHRLGDDAEVPGAWDLLTTPGGKWKTPWAAFFGYDGGDTRRRDFRPALEQADVGDDGYPDALIAETAIDQLTSLAGNDQPFMLFVGFYKPHLPFTAPKSYWDLYDREAIGIGDVDPIQRTAGEFSSYTHEASLPEDPDYARTLRHGYYAATSYADAQVGKVLAAVDTLGLRENTIVVLWGDHGYHLGERGYWGKHTLHEHALRSAFIVRSPGLKQPGVASGALTSSIDIYPTLVELVGLPMPDHLDGASFAALLEDPSAGVRAETLGFWEGETTIRTDRYRLVGDHSLFDHASDPGESVNVAADHPGIVERLSAQRLAVLERRKGR